MKSLQKTPLFFHFGKLLACVVWFFSFETSNAETYSAPGHSFFDSTYLLEVKQDTTLSLKAKELRYGGYETANGQPIVFDQWYTPNWSELQVAWLTQINKNFGIIWGISTGEQAEKYVIDPSLRLGFIYQREVKKNRFFSVTAYTFIGGELKEKTCTADYGEIGGIRTVNCRLAATTLEPEETLNYLVYAKPSSSVQLSFKYLF